MVEAVARVALKGAQKTVAQFGAKVVTVAIGSVVAGKINKKLTEKSGKKELRDAGVEGLCGGVALLAYNGLDILCQK